MAQLLRNIDVDEVSPVRRGANRKKVVLKHDEEAHVDTEIADILAIPWAREGAMVDELRKEGADDSVLRAAVGGMRLLTGVADELPEPMRSAVEKLGREMYPVLHPPLNQTGVRSDGGLVGEASGDDETLDADSDYQTGEDGVGNMIEFEGGGLSGSGSGKKVAADADMDDDDVAKDGKKPYGNVTYADPGYQSDKKARYPIDTEEHIRAAWSYINKPGNASKYSSGDLAKVKGRIRAAMKRIGADVAKSDEEIAAEEGGKIARLLLKAMRRKTDSEPDEDDDDVGKDDDNDDDDTAGAVEKGGQVDTHAVPVQKEDGSWDFTGVPDPARGFYEAVLKSADETRVKLEKAETELAETREELRTRDIIAKAEKQFAAVGAKDDVVAVLKDAGDKLSPEAYESLVGLLSAANTRIEQGDLFKELGQTVVGDGSDTDAWAKIEKAADELVEKSGDLTREQAIDRVLKTPEGARMYSAYLSESGMGVS